MVDFQQRDTKRGLDSDDVVADEGADDAASEGADDADGEGADDAASEGADDADGEGADDADGDADAPPDEPEAAEAEPPSDGDHLDHADDEGHHAHDLETVSVAVLTISTSRTIDEDPAGDAVVEALDDAGHHVATRNLVNDDYDGVQSEVDSLVRREDVDAVVSTGGTGVAPTDVTVEAVRPLFEKELPGFGELFRSLSYEEIGTRTIGTRAIAGVADGVPVFCLPGSEAAARLGTAEIVCPEVGHLAGLASRDTASRTPGQTAGSGG